MSSLEVWFYAEARHVGLRMLGVAEASFPDEPPLFPLSDVLRALGVFLESISLVQIIAPG